MKRNMMQKGLTAKQMEANANKLARKISGKMKGFVKGTGIK